MLPAHSQALRAAVATLLLGTMLVAGCSSARRAQPKAPADSGNASGATAPPAATLPGDAGTGKTGSLTVSTVRAEDVHSLPVGPARAQLGYTAPRAGGVSSLGPTSLAVDRQGRIYIWDQARARVLVYADDKVERIIPLPFAPPAAGKLLVYGDRLYLRVYRSERTGVELVADANSGALLMAPPFGLGTIYPRPRPSAPRDAGKGDVVLGEDDLGNSYVQGVACDFGVRRVAKDGQELACVAIPNKISHPEDIFVAADGSVYSLSWYTDNSVIDNVKVVRLLPPAGPAKPETDYPRPAPTTLAGRPVPVAVTLAGSSLPTTGLSEADRQSLWAILEWARPDAQAPAEPADRLIRLTATWSDGQSMAITVGSSNNATIDGAPYRVDSELLLALVRYAAASPAALLLAARQHGARVTIPDLPGVTHELTPAQLDQLAAALTGAFPVRASEIPAPVLELPFPRYKVVVNSIGGPVLEVFDDHYLWVGNPDVLAEGALLVPDGRLHQLVAGWLPAPAAHPGDVAYLYRAEKLTLNNGADLTRWKATVVRQLLGLRPQPGEFPDPTPLTLTFTVAGKPEVVTVTREGFTYGGKTYPIIGLLSLQQLQGVP